jgi:hypothetical protein
VLGIELDRIEGGWREHRAHPGILAAPPCPDKAAGDLDRMQHLLFHLPKPAETTD